MALGVDGHTLPLRVAGVHYFGPSRAVIERSRGCDPDPGVRLLPILNGAASLYSPEWSLFTQ